ncbi:hypothetical protein WPS_26850 [Vulcanimicrobium alpinum]|uniref:Uncharacterized protein n=1 Tax=Vulcanimicrobium alpinum TaxID=3016050 RepID=A0AAN2CAJ1_UNVUL|nr:hypothetical protein WPS_26850 [Vulcanimicrobium alpinum]
MSGTPVRNGTCFSPTCAKRPAISTQRCAAGGTAGAPPVRAAAAADRAAQVLHQLARERQQRRVVGKERRGVGETRFFHGGYHSRANAAGGREPKASAAAEPIR